MNATMIQMTRRVERPTGISNGTVAQQAAVARDNYLASAEDHRRIARQYPAFHPEHHAHLAIAGRFECKALDMAEIAVASQRVRRAVQA